MEVRCAELKIANRPPIPAAWEAAIAACLAKDPGQRPESIRHLQQALFAGLQDVSGANLVAALSSEGLDPAMKATVRATAPGDPSKSQETTALTAIFSRFSRRRLSLLLPAMGLCVAGLASSKLSRSPVATPTVLTAATPAATPAPLASPAATPAAISAATPAPTPSAWAIARADDEQKKRLLERARAILGRERLDEAQAFRAEILCENALSIDAGFRGALDLQRKAEAIREALHFESTATSTARLARWTEVYKLPPFETFPSVQAHLAAAASPASPPSGPTSVSELLGRIERARAALATRASQADFRLAEAKAEVRALSQEAMEPGDSGPLELAGALGRLIDEEQARVESHFASAGPQIEKLRAEFREVVAQPNFPGWENKALTLKAQIDDALKDLDYHQDDGAWTALYRQIAEARRKLARLPAVPPFPVGAPRDSDSSEQVYRGKMGNFDAIFYLTIKPEGRVDGHCLLASGKVHELRVEGRSSPSEMLLDEYTPSSNLGGGEELTAHLRLAMREMASEYRWEGTRHTAPPDSRSFFLSMIGAR